MKCKSNLLKNQLFVNAIKGNFSRKMITIDDLLLDLEIFDAFLQKLIIHCTQANNKLPYNLNSLNLLKVNVDQFFINRNVNIRVQTYEGDMMLVVERFQIAFFGTKKIIKKVVESVSVNQIDKDAASLLLENFETFLTNHPLFKPNADGDCRSDSGNG